MKYYSYQNFKHDIKILNKDLQSFDAQAIIGIARGGLSMAHAIAEGLNIREVQTLRTELYDADCKRNNINIFDNSLLNNSARVVVVDDISDSGETLTAVMQHLQNRYPEVTFRSATLFYKKTSIYKPHYWINEADEWIDFFWERDFKES